MNNDNNDNNNNNDTNNDNDNSNNDNNNIITIMVHYHDAFWAAFGNSFRGRGAALDLAERELRRREMKFCLTHWACISITPNV